MAALLLVLAATVLGLAAAGGLRADLPGWARLGVGLAAGQALLLGVPFGLALGLGTRGGAAAATGLLTAAAGAAVALAARRRGGVRGLLGALRAAATDDPAAGPLGLLAALLLAVLAWILHTHLLRPAADGLHSAGVSWGDLALHCALVTTFLERPEVLLAEHPLMAGAPLAYPFVPDHGVAVLASLGLSLRGAFIASGLGPLAALTLLVPAFARRVSGVAAPRALVLATLLFFLSGGLGAVALLGPLLRGAAPLDVLRAVDATYQPPAVLDANVVGNLLVAARGSAFGMALGAAALLLAAPAVREGRAPRRDLLLAGLLAGALPLVHAHSFVAVGLALAAWAAATARAGPGARRWAWLAAPAAALAAPQAAWIVLGAGGGGFARPLWGFLRPAPAPGAWAQDLVVGLGVALVLWPLAWRGADAAGRRLAAPLLLLVALANVWTFTPTPYENTKLLAWAKLAGAALAGPWLVDLARRRALLAATLVAAATTSGALALAHELVADARFLDDEAVRVAERVRAVTPPGALVLTGTTLHHPVALLTGRRVLLCGPVILATHGVDPRARQAEVRALWRGGPEAEALLRRWDPAAAVVGPLERAEVPDLDEASFARRARAVERVGGWTLYVLR